LWHLSQGTSRLKLRVEVWVQRVRKQVDDQLEATERGTLDVSRG